jgi:hypothetical protein
MACPAGTILHEGDVEEKAARLYEQPEISHSRKPGLQSPAGVGYGTEHA